MVGCGAAAFTRVGAASTHTQVQWDQMPKGYVSFDSGVVVVVVSSEIHRGGRVGGVVVLQCLPPPPSP